MTIDALTNRNLGLSLHSTADELAELHGDVDAELAAMWALEANESRSFAESSREATNENLQRQEDARVQAMLDEANAVRTDGLVGGLVAICAGGMNLAAAAMSLPDAASACGFPGPNTPAAVSPSGSADGGLGAERLHGRSRENCNRISPASSRGGPRCRSSIELAPGLTSSASAALKGSRARAV